MFAYVVFSTYGTPPVNPPHIGNTAFTRISYYKKSGVVGVLRLQDYTALGRVKYSGGGVYCRRYTILLH